MDKGLLHTVYCWAENHMNRRERNSNSQLMDEARAIEVDEEAADGAYPYSMADMTRPRFGSLGHLGHGDYIDQSMRQARERAPGAADSGDSAALATPTDDAYSKFTFSLATLECIGYTAGDRDKLGAHWPAALTFYLSIRPDIPGATQSPTGPSRPPCRPSPARLRRRRGMGPGQSSTGFPLRPRLPRLTE